MHRISSHTHHAEDKDVVTHCPTHVTATAFPFRGYHVVRYNVITPKWNAVAMGNNPLVSVHDVGAGGLSNAMPELVASGI